MIRLIQVYQKFISPMLGRGKCIYYETCSNYGIRMLKEYGTFRGLWYTLRRIWSCNPKTLAEARKHSLTNQIHQ